MLISLLNNCLNACRFRFLQWNKDAWVQSHLKDALVEMLGKGNGEDPEGIGPPYVILDVIEHEGQKPEIVWVAND